MRNLYSIIILAAGALFLFQSCQKQDARSFQQPDAANYSSKVATEWMHTLENVVQSEGKTPPQASRIYAYASISLYESVLPGMKEYRSLEGQIPGLVNLPQVSTYGQLNYTLTVNEALYQVSLKIFGVLKPENIASIEEMYSKIKSQDSAHISVDVFGESTAFGRAVAAAVLDRADNDGFATTRNMAYTVPLATQNSANWSPTGPVPKPLEPYWGQLKCFAMANGSACSIPSDIPFNTTPGSSFYNQALEVLTVNQHLTAEQKWIAYWWADGTGMTSTPPGHWVAIADQVAASKKLNLGKASEMYAMLNITLADAFISCWDEKYKLNLLRPVTYIRNYIAGNTSWSPLLSTPPFPEYPSGHSVASSAAAQTLTGVFGTFAFTDTTNTYLGLAPRTYASFEAAASEAAISRLYGGIHFREAIENGLKQGKEVSKAVQDKIRLKR